jgi:drug/metabolite transporter (DMT)-like permease
MFPAFAATLFFSLSVITATRSVKLLGSHRANFWRVLVTTLLLGAWAHSFGTGFGGSAFIVFFLSGCVGFGLGDMALFLAIPRLGPRLSSLLINCLAPPFAACIEWIWLGTRLSLGEAACSALILAGVGMALLPEGKPEVPKKTDWFGILNGVVAGFGQGFGAVLSRKAFALAAQEGVEVDGGTAAYQRILGGLAFVLIPTVWWLWRRRTEGKGVRALAAPRMAWKWVVANALCGPAIGVACFQWALRSTPSGIVLPIVATTPLVVIPLTYWFEGDRPGWRSICGGGLAVAGVILLTQIT